MNQYIYHYTHLQAAIEISTSEFVRVSQYERDNNINPPVLWLSLHPLWELTATKAIRDEKGNIIPLTFEEQHQKLGCVRFVFPFDKENLISWDEYKIVAKNTNKRMLAAMESKNVTKGANPSDWYASLKDIPLTKIIACQMWDGENWQTIQIDELKELKNI